MDRSQAASARRTDPSQSSLVDSLFSEFGQLPLLTVLGAVREARRDLAEESDGLGRGEVADRARSLLRELSPDGGAGGPPTTT